MSPYTKYKINQRLETLTLNPVMRQRNPSTRKKIANFFQGHFLGHFFTGSRKRMLMYLPILTLYIGVERLDHRGQVTQVLSDFRICPNFVDRTTTEVCRAVLLRFGTFWQMSHRQAMVDFRSQSSIWKLPWSMTITTPSIKSR